MGLKPLFSVERIAPFAFKSTVPMLDHFTVTLTHTIDVFYERTFTRSVIGSNTVHATEQHYRFAIFVPQEKPFQARRMIAAST